MWGKSCKFNSKRYAGLVFENQIFWFAEENHTFQCGRDWSDIQGENDVEYSSKTSHLGLIMIAKVLCFKAKMLFNHMLDWLWRTELIHQGSSLFPIILCNDS